MSPTKTVNVANAKKSLSELLGRVAYARESFTIVKRGRPMARLVPADAESRPVPAKFRGWMDDDDPFLKIVDGIVAARHRHHPRRTLRR